MQTYYVSLVHGLFGYYVKFLAPSEQIVRRHLHEYFGRMWCGVYTPTKFEGIKAQYPSTVINEDKPIELMAEE